MFSGWYGLKSLMQASNTNNNNPPHYVGRDSSVGIATGYGIGRSGDRIPGGGGEIFHKPPDRPWDPHSLLYNGYRVFPGVKRPGRGIDHSRHLEPRLKKE